MTRLYEISDASWKNNKNNETNEMGRPRTNHPGWRDAKYQEQNDWGPSGRLHLSKIAFSIFLLMGYHAAMAQIVADGTTQTASGVVNTGIATAVAGYALYATNGGTIQSVSPLTLITGGGSASVVNAASGGRISLYNGSLVSASGAMAYGIDASGVGSEVTATGTTINTTGGSAYGVAARSGGTVDLTGGAIGTTGDQSSALFAFQEKGTINASGTIINTNGNDAAGANANVAGTINLTNGTITTAGQRADGLVTFDTAASITATGTTITTTGNGAIGAHDILGQMTLNDVTVLTRGSNANGVTVDTAKGVSTVTSGSPYPSTATMNGGSVITSGSGSQGLLAIASSTLTASGVTVQTYGDNSAGVSAQLGGQVALTGGSVTTAGDQSFGLFSVGLPGTVGAPGTSAASLTADGVTVNTSGSQAQAAFVTGGSSLTITGSTLTAQGSGADALHSQVYDSTAPAVATITDSTLSAAQGDAIHTIGGPLNVSLIGSFVTGGQYLMASDRGGILNVAADYTTLTGATYTDLTSTANLALGNMSTWVMTGPSMLTNLEFDGGVLRYGAVATLDIAGLVTLDSGGGTIDTNGFDATLDGTIQGAGSLTKTGIGTLTLIGANTWSGDATVAAGVLKAGSVGAFSPASNFTIDSAGTLDLNGFNQTVGGLKNGGMVHMGAAPGTVLTVAGNYVGNGGVIAMNTVLGDSSSATDLLHVQGTTSGSTGLQITNAGGLGAQTTGDGIMLVKVDGASNGTFSPTGRVAAGAYEYTLYKNGVGTDAVNGNWYLRSTLETERVIDKPVIPPDEPAIPPVATVAYRPGVVGYAMTPLLNVDYGFTTLGTLHQRVGDVPGAVRTQNSNSDGIWARIGGQELNVDTLNRFSTSSHTFFAQFGKDWTLDQPQHGGSTHAGVAVTIGSSSAQFVDSARSIVNLSPSTGSVQTQAQSLGGYWTRYLKDGSYFDSVAQVTHYHNTYSDSDGNCPDQNGFGVTLSQEIGKPFQVGNLPVAIEPQAQLMYQYVNLKGFNDNVSGISGTTTNALRGRVGFRMFNADMENASRTGAATPYFTANVLRDFLVPGQTVVGGTSFNSGFARTWYELGLGVTASYGKRGELYASATYSRNLGGPYRQGVYGQAGYRYSW